MTLPASRRRAPWHNYHDPKIYPITITNLPDAPTLSNIIDGEMPYAEPTPAGLCVEEAFHEVIVENPCMSIIEHVIMPDHIHYVIYIRQRLPREFGAYIGWAKSKATAKLRQLFRQPERNFFTPNFNDSILSGHGQLTHMIKYVQDNPRRLLVKRANRQFFTKLHNVEIGGERFDACGNLFLLDSFEFAAVIVHRRWTNEELQVAKEKWRECVINGGVLVSAFISKVEKEVLCEAIESGGRAIILTPEAITERYKPAGEYFKLCAAGRLLIMHPSAMPSRTYGGISREECLTLNRAAELIFGNSKKLLNFAKSKFNTPSNHERPQCHH